MSLSPPNPYWEVMTLLVREAAQKSQVSRWRIRAMWEAHSNFNKTITKRMRCILDCKKFSMEVWMGLLKGFSMDIIHFMEGQTIKRRCRIVALIKLLGRMVLRSAFIVGIGTLLKAMLLMLSNGSFRKGRFRKEVTLLIQSAFVADRQIIDGPFILNELVQWCKKKKKKAMIFKVDFEKAYDSVRWDFVHDILKKFEFGEKWCKWIQSCLHSFRGSVIVNGSPTKEFQFYKGLKQGDPLSPFLFIQRVVDACLFKGIKVASPIHISHLFYTDDAIFMGQWNQSNIDTITRVLEVFHRASGLRINMNKRSRVGGLMSRIQSWNDIIESMVSRLSRWKLKTLSIGGRLTILKSVLGAIPIYRMSIFKVPMKVLQNMESIRSRFFNGADINSKKPSWVRWKNVMAYKDTGGLGVQSLFALNRALMFKWVWRFISQKSSLWASVIKALHGEDGKIAWRGDVAFKVLVPRLYALETMKNMDVASKLSHDGLEFSFRRNPRVGVEQAQLELLKEKVEGCILSNMNDRWAWSLEGSGEFSMSSVRKVIDATLLPKGTTKTRWIKAVPIKINVHAWKVKHDCLPTRVDISRSGMEIESMLCPVCDNAVESSMHLFFSCYVISELMRKITRWWDMDYMGINSFEEWLEWVSSIRLPLKQKQIFEGMCYILWWFIWNWRNKKIFGRETPSKAIIFYEVVSRSFNWIRFRCKAKFSWIEWLKNPHLISL
nr:hypothetical protein [Tanacetum cinerariifolium]